MTDRSKPSSTAAAFVERTVRPAIRGLSAYHVPPAGDYVKLDAMENPYTLPPDLQNAWLQALRDTELNRYPDSEAASLKDALRSAFDVPTGAGILLGNGSDEIIQIIQTAIGGPVLAPEPTFVMYDMVARFLDAGFVGVPLDDAFALDAAAILAAIERHRPAVVFLAFPNNPTGNLFDEAVIRRVVESAPGLVVVDEAYHAFTDRSLMPWIDAHPNLLVMRTLSKLGLAGLRLGFAAAHPAWIAELDKVRLPYNVGVLTRRTTVFALEHLSVFTEQAARIKSERRRVCEALAAAGYQCFPSDANFLLFRCREPDAEQVFQALLERGVLIKNLSEAHPALAGCLRMTVGTPEENDRFLAALPHG